MGVIMNDRVPFIDLSRLAARIGNDVLDDWRAILERQEFVGGPRVAELESVIATQLGVGNVVACSNGTDALIVALQSMGIGPGSKVALPNLTFWASFEAVVQVRATPVLLDIDAEDLQLSSSALFAAAAHRDIGVDAVLLPHLYGWASGSLDLIRGFCQNRQIPLLEDGAQAFGVRQYGLPLFTNVWMGTLSFYPAKVIGGAMDGGAVLCRSAEQCEGVRSLCNHGRAGHYLHGRVGWNSRMGGLQASYLRRVLSLADEIVSSRRTAAEWYRERLKDVAGVQIYGPPEGVTENGYLNVLTVEDPVMVSAALEERGIATGRTYPVPISEQPATQTTDAIASGDLSVSKEFCKKVLNLPLFYGITCEEQEKVASALIEVIR